MRSEIKINSKSTARFETLVSIFQNIYIILFLGPIRSNLFIFGDLLSTVGEYIQDLNENQLNVVFNDFLVNEWKTKKGIFSNGITIYDLPNGQTMRVHKRVTSATNSTSFYKVSAVFGSLNRSLRLVVPGFIQYLSFDWKCHKDFQYYVYNGVYFEWFEFNEKQKIMSYLAVISIDLCVETFRRLGSKRQAFASAKQMIAETPLKDRNTYIGLMLLIGEDCLHAFEHSNQSLINEFIPKIKFEFKD